MDSLALVLGEALEATHRGSLKFIEEVVHVVGLSFDDFNVLLVVVSVGSGDLVKQVEALLKLLVEHHVVDGALHSCYHLCELVLLVLHDFVVVVSTVCECYLKVDLCLLELLLVLVEHGSKLLEEGKQVICDLAHLVIEVLLVSNCIHDQSARLKLPAFNVGLSSCLDDDVES